LIQVSFAANSVFAVDMGLY